MKAAVVNSVGGGFTIEDIEIAEPIGREVLFDVKASGLCRSDLTLSTTNFGFPFPQVLGHEAAGIVTAVGPDVKEIKVGDHVVASLIQYCGHCRACRESRMYECEFPEETLRGPDEAPRLSRKGEPIFQTYGIAGFAEQALVHEHQIAKINPEMPFPQACVIGCAVITGAGAALNTAQVRPGDTVAVVGLGGVGLSIVNGARIAGAGRIIGVDTNPEKEEFGKKFGMTHFVNAGDSNVIEQIFAATDGRGVDKSFEALGIVPTMETAIAATRQGGDVYVAGVFKPEMEWTINPLNEFFVHRRHIHAVYMGNTDIKTDIPQYVEFYQQGRLHLDDLVATEIALDDIDATYQAMAEHHAGIGRVVITSF